MGSAVGAEKSAAAKTGVSHSEWKARRLRGERWCFRCRAWKAGEAFQRDGNRNGGLASSCKPCASNAATASRYRMTISDLAAFRAARGYKCEICGNEGQHIDHNHQTGQVRGLLCANCNSAIGKLRESPALFAAALAYLEKQSG